MAHILIVDDEDITVTVARAFLHLEGHVVATAMSVDAAFKKTQNSPFDLVVIDIKMKGLDAEQLCRQIKHLYPDTRCVAMTEYSHDTTPLGFDTQVAKPFIKVEFLQAVDSALSKKSG